MSLKSETISMKMKQDDKTHSKSAPVLCLYASDSSMNERKTNKVLYFRQSPFNGAVTHNQGSSTCVRQLLQHDATENIYYFPVGVPPKRLSFDTSHWKWPAQYTVIMWVRWKRNASCITTFDSGSNTPIYGSYDQLGCASGYSGWLTIDDYRMTFGSWQFVTSFGGNNESTFYIGDLQKEPECIGSVQCCVSGKETYRIGNSSQGPGDVACIYVFDRHLGMEELKQLYHESIITMGQYWSKQEVAVIRQMLTTHLQIDGIVCIVFRLLLGRLSDQLL